MISRLPSVRFATLLLPTVLLLLAGCQVQTGSIPFLTAAPLKAQSAVPPPFPARNAPLLGFAVPGAGATFRYALIPDSITLARGGVVRYVVVIDTPDGTRNVLYEGMRCATRRYETYAVGVGGGPFSRIDRPRWRRLLEGGSDAFREVLYRDYLCTSFGEPRAPHAVRRRLRAPGWNGDGDGT